MPTVSIIVPAYNEERRLPPSLARIRAFLDVQCHITSEVIVVDDGSSDQTASIVRQAMDGWPSLRLVAGSHAGKGGAVRAGIWAAHGQFVAIADADLAMPIHEFVKFNSVVFADHELAIASRAVPGARIFNESRKRHLMGRVFNALVQVLLLPGIKDTQCGFKVIRRDVALEICRHQTIMGWGFDVEWLVIARKHGFRIREVPATIHYEHEGSRVNPVSDSLRIAWELLRIKRNAVRGLYEPEPSAPDEVISVQPSEQTLAPVTR